MQAIKASESDTVTLWTLTVISFNQMVDLAIVHNEHTVRTRVWVGKWHLYEVYLSIKPIKINVNIPLVC